MKRTLCTLLFVLCASLGVLGQVQLVDVQQKTFNTSTAQVIQGQVGYLEVPENRTNPESRKIRVKYTWLHSTSENPEAPTLYIEGGGGSSTWQAEDPEALTDWLSLLSVSDLILFDRRGTDDEALLYIWEADFPKDFFVTEAAANLHYSRMAEKALATFGERGVDVAGYTIEEHARDVNELMTALDLPYYNILGFSFGSHIGMTAMKLFPKNIAKAILVGSDAPNQSFNYPRYLESHIEKVAQRVAQDTVVHRAIPDFKRLVYDTLHELEQQPITVTLQNPITNEAMPLKIGAFGLAWILRLEIDDYDDLPVMPRLLYSIEQGDYSILEWFVQKRLAYAIALPGNGINQQLASGVANQRWSQIQREVQKSVFGNVVNFPFSAAKDHWVPNALSFDSTEALQTNIPTLFITGDLDCRTPIEQVVETMQGFGNAQQIKVVNAGHEQALWAAEIADNIVPGFLTGQKIEKTEVYYADLNFLKVSGNTQGHPSLR